MHVESVRSSKVLPLMWKLGVITPAQVSSVAYLEWALYQNSLGGLFGDPLTFRDFLDTCWGPLAWGPRIIDTDGTLVATPLGVILVTWPWFKITRSVTKRFE
ncbi:hypothetical protein TNCV_83491 [Trichonephila clavipes]|nr:hypothetical protein TNCV_83491 [Trichonephila clavipes]